MTRKLLFLVLLILMSISDAFAQGNDADLQKAQKAMKDSLIKHAPYVSSVKFVKCRVLITLSSPGVGTFLGNGGNAPGGGFSGDDASGYLSSGSKAEYVRGDEFEHYEMDLARLNPKNITLIPPYRKDLSRVDLVDTSGKSAIGIRRKNKLEPRPVFTFFVKEKAGEETVKALQEALNQCEKH